MEATEQGANFRHVVEGQDELAFDLPQTLRELRKVSLFKVVPIEFPPEIWRIEKKERRRPVVVAEHRFVRKTVNLYSFQSLMSVFNELGKTFWVEPRRLDHVPMIGGMAYQARE